MTGLRRAVLAAVALLGAGGIAAGTSATFDATTSNLSSFSTDALNAPRNLTVTPVGNAIEVAWTPGSMASGETSFTHRVTRTAWSTSEPTCTASSAFTTSVASLGSGAASTSIDTTSVRGQWTCVTVDIAHPVTNPFWFSQENAVEKVQAGHVVRSVTISNGGAAGTIDSGDVIELRFNQQVDVASGPVSTNATGTTAPTAGNGICTRTNGNVINIGRTGLGSCGNNEAVVVGKLSGVSLSGSSNAYNASYAWSDCSATGTGCRVLRATVGGRYNGNQPNTSTVGTAFDATNDATKLVSARGGGVPICIASDLATVQTCRPVPTGSF